MSQTILKSRTVASFWEARDELHDENSALATVRKDGTKIVVAATQERQATLTARLLKIATSSSEGDESSCNARSKKRGVEQDKDGVHKRTRTEGLPADDEEDSEGCRTPSPSPRNETFTTPQKPRLFKDTLQYLQQHVKITVNEQCVILRHTEVEQVAELPSALRSWLVNVLLVSYCKSILLNVNQTYIERLFA